MDEEEEEEEWSRKIHSGLNNSIITSFVLLLPSFCVGVSDLSLVYNITAFSNWESNKRSGQHLTYTHLPLNYFSQQTFIGIFIKSIINQYAEYRSNSQELISCLQKLNMTLKGEHGHKHKIVSIATELKHCHSSTEKGVSNSLKTKEDLIQLMTSEQWIAP